MPINTEGIALPLHPAEAATAIPLLGGRGRQKQKVKTQKAGRTAGSEELQALAFPFLLKPIEMGRGWGPALSERGYDGSPGPRRLFWVGRETERGGRDGRL